MDKLKRILPEKVSIALDNLDASSSKGLNEIRLRINKPIYLYINGEEFGIKNRQISRYSEEMFSIDDAREMWRKLCEGSPYSKIENQRSGYITVGGNRIGFCGEYASVDGDIRHIEEATSFCVRISHQVLGCSNKVYKYLYDSNVIQNTLIVSPPGCGKTTLIRDIARILSFDGANVCICDERNEISGSIKGIAQYDIGKRTDVILGANKKTAINNMIRSVKPDVVVVDEIGETDDVEILNEAKKRGVKIFATAHGTGESESLLRFKGIFDRYILLSADYGIGTVGGVFDKDLNKIAV